MSQAGQFVMTPTGTKLAGDGCPTATVQKGLEAWKELPEDQRKPSGELPGLEFEEPTSPPPGGLIFKAYVRGLERDAKGGLHRCEIVKVAGGDYGYPVEPSADHVWLTEAEWKNLIPAKPRVGDKMPVPAALVERIATFHLRDTHLGSPPFFWGSVSGEMGLTVEEASPGRLRMRLDGTATLGDKAPYPVRFQGFVHYDRTKKAIARWDMVALGRDNGELRPGDTKKQLFNSWYELQEGCTPLMAVAFELVSADSPLNRVPPYAVMYRSDKTYNKPYFATAK